METIAGFGRPALERARKSRDPRFDGKFFIAVTSTGIYCRPVCPVRTSKPSNIRYYATAAAAAEAGFRPCLRCRPEAAPGTPAWQGTSALVRRALQLIQEGALDEGSVDSLASRLGIGPRHLHRLFVTHVGASPITVAQTRRIHFAKRLLDETALPMTQIAMAAGFGSLRRFNEVFQRTYSRSPSALRRGAGRTADRDQVVMHLAFRPPYDWSSVRDFLSARALPGVEHVEGDTYTRTVSLDRGRAMVSVAFLAGRDALELRVQGASPGELFALASCARRVFDLASDPAEVASVFRKDSLLGPLVAKRPGLRIPGTWDPFECAVRAILGQQVSVSAGRTLAARLVDRFGTPIEGCGPLTHLFPSAQALASADLSGIGLTGARVRTLGALAQAVCRAEVDFRAPAEDVSRALQALPGIGEWTAQYVALRALGEPDAFPTGDLVLRRAAGQGGSSLSARALSARAEAWRPWRGYATLHLWKEASAIAPPRKQRAPGGRRAGATR